MAKVYENEAAVAALAVGRLARRPVVYHGHTALADELPTYFRRAPVRRIAAAVGRLVDAHVPRRADFCIAVSEELGDVLRRRGVAPDDLACILPAVGPGERPTPTAAPDTPARGLVCYAGNLDGYQNLDFLRRAFGRVRARVPSARLVVLGSVAPPPGLHDPGAGIEVVRAASWDAVRSLLATADVAVSPRAERSGFPMKLLNYMAAAKAVVVSAGSAKAVRHGLNGVVVRDDDAALPVLLLEQDVVHHLIEDGVLDPAVVVLGQRL